MFDHNFQVGDEVRVQILKGSLFSKIRKYVYPVGIIRKLSGKNKSKDGKDFFAYVELKESLPEGQGICKRQKQGDLYRIFIDNNSIYHNHIVE